MKRVLLAAVISTAAFCAGAQAQDYSLNPTFGTVNLSAGFMPDPYRVEVVSSGDIDASWIQGCVGMISDAPDVRLNYQAGGFELFLNVASDSDTTLVVNGPDGQWYCDDDSGGNLTPGLAFSPPMSGQYDIWIGSYQGDYANAELQISEIRN